MSKIDFKLFFVWLTEYKIYEKLYESSKIL